MKCSEQYSSQWITALLLNDSAKYNIESRPTFDTTSPAMPRIINISRTDSIANQAGKIPSHNGKWIGPLRTTGSFFHLYS